MPSNSIGYKLAVATGNPAAFTEVGYEALTWVDIGGLEEIGELGEETALISSGNLTTGRVSQLKGATSGVSTTLMFTEESGDTGQAALIAAARDYSSQQYSLRVSEPGVATAPEQYYSGTITNYKPGPRNLTSLRKFSVVFTSNVAPVSGT